MTAAVLDRPATLFADAPTSAAGSATRGRVTLEARLNAVLDEARANGRTECPVCQSEMSFTRAGGSAEPPGAAECADCGSRLS
jgi:hypothetical protein